MIKSSLIFIDCCYDCSYTPSSCHKLIQQSRKQMKVATGFIFYFLLAIIAITFSMFVFIFRPFRRLLHKVQTKYNNILNNQIFSGIIYFSFAIIGIILLESLYSFFIIHRHLTSQSHLLAESGLDNLDLVRGHHSHSIEDTLLSIREHKEYYLAERNIMLTSSAFFAYFILDRIFFNIRKLADVENQIENPDQKSVFDQEKNNEKGKLKSQ